MKATLTVRTAAWFDEPSRIFKIETKTAYFETVVSPDEALNETYIHLKDFALAETRHKLTHLRFKNIINS